MVLLGVVPGLDQAIAHRVCGSLVSTLVIEIEACAGQSVLDVVDDRALDAALISADVRAHQLPELLLAFSAFLGTELRPVQGRGLLLLIALCHIESRVFPLDRLGDLFVIFDWCGGLGSCCRLRDELWVDLLLLVEIQFGGKPGSSLLS